MVDLAKPGDPYIGGDGKLITMDDEDVLIASPEPRKVLPSFTAVSVTKELSMENLPETDIQQQTVISAVVGLRLMGLSDVDIADVLNTNLPQIQSIVKLPAAQQSFELMYQNLIHVNSENIQGRISAHAGKAVDVVTGMMENEDIRDDVRLKAAQDVLDRSGTHPDQFFGDSNTGSQADDELRIVVLSEDGQSERVRVDINKKR